MSRVLVTGGTGYIGSHACIALRAAGHDVVAVDNFDNSSRPVLDRVVELAGEVTFVELDVRDHDPLLEVFRAHRPDAVMHLAGLKAVGESVARPLRYVDVNVGSTVALLKVMAETGTRDLVFSSSCTVYGNPSPDLMPLDEGAPIAAANPYGRTKITIERLLQDMCASDPDWRVMSLRYFNPVGAHESGYIGEDPIAVPTNLMPYVMQTAVGRHEYVRIFGGDYPTPDGTCIRDYIHVMDLVEAHVAAIEQLGDDSGFEALNLGTGAGSSVLEVLRAAEAAVGRAIPHRVVERRPGDAVAVYADPTRAVGRLGWKAERDLSQMCTDHWRWQSLNPLGYRT